MARILSTIKRNKEMEDYREQKCVLVGKDLGFLYISKHKSQPIINQSKDTQYDPRFEFYEIFIVEQI